jgi:hypothetical protein
MTSQVSLGNSVQQFNLYDKIFQHIWYEDYIACGAFRVQSQGLHPKLIPSVEFVETMKSEIIV